MLNFLLFVAILLATIWGVNLAIRGSLLLSCGLYLVVAGAVGYEFWNFNVGSISLSLDRILLLVIVVSYPVQWKLGKTSPKDVSASEKGLLLFFGILLVNTFAHEWNRSSPDQVPIVPHLIEGYLIPLTLYWVARRTLMNEREVDRFYGLVAIFGIYLAFTAVCEIVGAWGLVFPKIIADPTRGIHFGRARGPFLQSVRLGIYLLAGLAAVWVPLVWRQVWGRPGRALGLLLTPLFLVGLFFTYTRSIWLGTAAATCVLFGLTCYGRWRRLVFLSMAASALVVVVVAGSRFTSFEREYGSAETQESTEMRGVFAYVSWLMFQDKPLTGFGFGHFPHENRPYLNDRSTELHMESIRGYIHHNTYLSLLVELGILGLLLYVAVLVGWSYQGWLLWNDRQAPTWMRGQALLLMILMPHLALQMLFHDVSYSPLENGLLFVTAGVTSGMCALRGVRRQSFSTWLRSSLGPRTEVRPSSSILRRGEFT